MVNTRSNLIWSSYINTVTSSSKKQYATYKRKFQHKLSRCLKKSVADNVDFVKLNKDSITQNIQTRRNEHLTWTNFTLTLNILKMKQKNIMKCFFVFCLCQSSICYKLENNIYRNYDVITSSLLNANKYKQQERRPPSDDITKHV